ncbi:DUF4365 domain-containing protein [Herbidospora sp. NBRC 101105]|uniref:DUF4365 domain-containing protein n=1 Tax=Herbidospora sp. NBRC 101105 TaxID=3032195 RepID=UPI0024A416F6|nr:DUF4365 domain-containing protein [Herbidospora sp. NBRC 101105]GLX96122.1 hypothetical protein Hesp01_40720 [Herbidospora sp. NBRC 101105]
MVLSTQDPWDELRTPQGAPYGTMHMTHCKEQFSLAFVHAITAAARCKISDLRVDDERVDFTVRQTANHRVYSSAVVDVQMKCTEQDVLKDDGVHWRLSRDHYDALRDPHTYNRKILVVLLVPSRLGEWLEVSDEGMLLRRSAYWTCLEGGASIDTDSKTVVLPRERVFTVGQLLAILQRVGDGGAP